jgi:phosphonate degradation associated HDIG domain protein
VNIVDDLMSLYDSPSAHRLYDEVVTERDHALQCAALAVRDGADDDLVAAALLHDVGHLLLDDNVALGADLAVGHGHDAVGARHLARWFPASVTAPIALHVIAKRYLCASEPEYYARLSPSSRRSLNVQGGPLSTAAARTFERRPGSAQAVAVRRWDDMAKVDGLEVPDLDHYTPRLRSLVAPPVR